MIEKDIVTAAIVRAFFKYYVTGVIEAQNDCNMQECFEPKNIKRVMLDHYEQISELFNQEAFYAIAKMNYEAGEIEEILRRTVTPATTSADLVRMACRTEEIYNVMVEEYKRNFINLLEGRIETQDEHINNMTRKPEAGNMDTDRAEEIVNRMAANAYELGRQHSKGCNAGK